MPDIGKWGGGVRNNSKTGNKKHWKMSEIIGKWDDWKNTDKKEVNSIIQVKDFQKWFS